LFLKYIFILVNLFNKNAFIYLSKQTDNSTNFATVIVLNKH